MACLPGSVDRCLWAVHLYVVLFNKETKSRSSWLSYDLIIRDNVKRIYIQNALTRLEWVRFEDYCSISCLS